MRIIEVNVYKYSELSERAQERAREWYRDGLDYPWSADNREALEAFAKHFGITRLDWSYDTCRGSARGQMPEHAEVIRGLRLYAWLYHNHADYLWSPKYIGKKCRAYSKVHVTRSCPTGYRISEFMMEPIYYFLDDPDSRTTLAELLQDCLSQWALEASKDMALYYSDEQIAESIKVNDYEFDANGKAL